MQINISDISQKNKCIRLASGLIAGVGSVTLLSVKLFVIVSTAVGWDTKSRKPLEIPARSEARETGEALGLRDYFWAGITWGYLNTQGHVSIELWSQSFQAAGNIIVVVLSGHVQKSSRRFILRAWSYVFSLYQKIRKRNGAWMWRRFPLRKVH